MKKIVLVFIIPLFIACSENDDHMEAIMNEMEEVMNPFVMGDFVSRAHPTSGKATVSSDKLKLSFTNFKTDNGPKLLVYLSTDENSSEFVNLGDLKGIEGNFTYDIPSNTDLGKYKLVNIWCVDFSVSFGTAELK
mgnify:CR=1 FL=1